MHLPWQVSATLAVVSFIALRWGFPAWGSDQPFYRHLISTGAAHAWILALIFGVVAVLSAGLAKRKRALLDGQRDLESLRQLGWQEFEWLVGEAYRRQGYRVEESLGVGADGGVDVMLRKGNDVWLVQCKQWRTQSVGAPTIREIFGLVSHHQATGAIVITSGHFTRDALAFAEGKPIELINGKSLLDLVKSVQKPSAATGRVTTPPPLPSPAPVVSVSAPTCPACGSTMLLRMARKGPNAGNQFWGCPSYPRCRGVRPAVVSS